MSLSLEDFRREYTKGGLSRHDLAECPFEQFERWMQQAIESNIADPNAMTIATVDKDGQPSQRIVLLKHADERGFVFYTNLKSKKAQDLSVNKKISLHFPWHMLERQIKIRGEATPLSASEVLSYFLSRPRESQLGAWASHQSQKISSRQLLMQQFESMKRKFGDGQIPVPDFWGGYRVVPTHIEFWQGGAYRLHDRFLYSRDEQNRWTIDRLEP